MLVYEYISNWLGGHLRFLNRRPAHPKQYSALSDLLNELWRILMCSVFCYLLWVFTDLYKDEEDIFQLSKHRNILRNMASCLWKLFEICNGWWSIGKSWQILESTKCLLIVMLHYGTRSFTGSQMPTFWSHVYGRGYVILQVLAIL